MYEPNLTFDVKVTSRKRLRIANPGFQNLFILNLKSRGAVVSRPSRDPEVRVPVSTHVLGFRLAAWAQGNEQRNISQ